MIGCASGLAGAQTAPPASPPPAEAPRVNVQRWQVQGNTLLPADELAGVLQAFTGPLTSTRLREATLAVQALYRDAGYGGVVAFLPEQDLAGGLALLRVVEGRLAQVQVRGQQKFSEANVRASLPSLAVGRTPAVRRIDAEIQMANENPAKGVQVLLQPGAGTGEIVAQVTVAEQPLQRFSARLDNTGARATGRWRAALGWQHANLWDADHVFATEVQTAPENPGAVRVLSGSYRAPLYGRAMALDAYAAWSDVDAGSVATAAGDLLFSGKGTVSGLRLGLYLPRLGNTDQRVLVGVEHRDYRNSCTLLGLGQAACGAAGASVSLQPASLTYTVQASGEWRWGASIGLHSNLALGGRHAQAADFEAVRSGSRARYSLLRGAAQLSLPLGEQGQASARLNAQYSGQPLVPGEMFGAGGAQSVRGYEERELSGDSGFTLSLEAQGGNLLQAWPAAAGIDLRALLFTDAGEVANADDALCLAGRSRCTLGSLGGGLRLSWQSLQARLDVARALASASSTAAGDLRAHVSLYYSF